MSETEPQHWSPPAVIGREVLAEMRALRREFAELRAELDLRLRKLELAAARAEGEDASRRRAHAFRVGAIAAAVSASVYAVVSRLAGFWFHS